MWTWSKGESFECTFGVSDSAGPPIGAKDGSISGEISKGRDCMAYGVLARLDVSCKTASFGTCPDLVALSLDLLVFRLVHCP